MSLTKQNQTIASNIFANLFQTVDVMVSAGEYEVAMGILKTAEDYARTCGDMESCQRVQDKIGQLRDMSNDLNYKTKFGENYDDTGKIPR